jgi:hypothetical protein
MATIGGKGKTPAMGESDSRFPAAGKALNTSWEYLSSTDGTGCERISDESLTRRDSGFVHP